MNVTPASDNVLVFSPETDVEAFFVRRFMEVWRKGAATIVFRENFPGDDPSSRLEIYSPGTKPNILDLIGK